MAFVTKTIPAKYGKRTIVTKPGYWNYGTMVTPGYWKYESKYIPPKTTRTKVKEKNGYRYVTKTEPGKYVKTRTWVSAKKVPNNTWVPAQTREER